MKAMYSISTNGQCHHVSGSGGSSAPGVSTMMSLPGPHVTSINATSKATGSPGLRRKMRPPMVAKTTTKIVSSATW